MSKKQSALSMKATWECKSLLVSIFVFYFCLGGVVVIGVEGAENTGTITSIVGQDANLPCEVNNEQCGLVHNIKWYKSGSRVYIASSDGSGRSEGVFAVPHNRADFNVSASPPLLHIYPVDIQDEAEYKCEVTYASLQDGCPTVSFVQLQTIVGPRARTLKENGKTKPLEAGVKVGPYDEGGLANLTCEALGAKPAANVSWWNGTQTLGGVFTKVPESNVTTTSTSTIQFTVGREDVLSTLECRISHAALPDTLITPVQLDVHVAPRGIELEFDNEQLYEGSNATLTCRGLEARPKAWVIWLNGSRVIEAPPSITEPGPPGFEDHIVTTVSTLSFVASRYENGESFTCQVENNVTRNKDVKPLSKSITLNVYYPPVADLKPEGDITVLEGDSLDVICNYEAHPSNLTGVAWHKDDVVIKATGDLSETTEAAHPSESENANEANDDYEDEDRTGDNAPRLVLSPVTRHDAGIYRCLLKNAAGTTESTQFLNLSVTYPPLMQLVVSPSLVKENETDVELACDLVAASPRYLDRYEWLRNGAVINETNNSTLLLANVDRRFHGNYSCRARNQVGWGNVSAEAELNVLYPPGKAMIAFQPSTIVKGQTVTLWCNVYDVGNPPVSRYKWMQGKTLISDVLSRNWTINSVNAQTRSTVTCIPQNSAGDGESASFFIDVLVPPAFVKALDPSHGAPQTSSNVSMSCQVECWPTCEMEWLRNGVNLANNPMYTIITSRVPVDTDAPAFPAVVSTLRWNMTAWAGGKLDRHKDNANYTCRSSQNRVGPRVSSTTSFIIEYAPENITVSAGELNVIEGEVPPPVLCTSDALPKPNYDWLYVTDNDVVTSGPLFNLTYPIWRDKQGVYACRASNRHGYISVNMSLTVLYEPKCHIEKLHATDDGNAVLACVVDSANPQKVDFKWFHNNETIIDDISYEEDEYSKSGNYIVFTEGLISKLTVAEHGRVYSCQVNNSVGSPCTAEIEIQGPAGSGYAQSTVQRITLIAAIIAAVFVVIILLVIIVICIRRRRDKSRMNMEHREGPDGRPQSDSKSGKSARKPGVLKKKRAPSPVADGDRAFYENLPFHGLQPPPNKPFRPELADLEYADVDFPPRQVLNNNEQPQKASPEVAEMEGNSMPRRPPRARPNKP